MKPGRKHDVRVSELVGYLGQGAHSVEGAEPNTVYAPVANHNNTKFPLTKKCVKAWSHSDSHVATGRFY